MCRGVWNPWVLQGSWEVPGAPWCWWGGLRPLGDEGGGEGLESLGEGVLALLGAVGRERWLIWWQYH